MVFKLYAVYNKHEIKKICNQAREISQVLNAADCVFAIKRADRGRRTFSR